MDPTEFEDEDGTPSSYHLSEILQDLFGPIDLENMAERIALAESETNLKAEQSVFPRRTRWRWGESERDRINTSKSATG
jgi:hypothetical protein